ncbi:MAG: FMN-binding protein [Clostridium sp.]|jgi:electron transport complex protein RnfG|nr:FMN-binding protein [Clostridium sp.]
MKKKLDIKELLTLGGVLTLICVIVAGIVSTVYITTAEQIALNNAVSSDDLAIIMPEGDTIEDMTGEFEPNENITEIYKALSGSEEVGYVYKTVVVGYKPDLTVLVGVSLDGNVVAAKISQSQETPGLGSLVAEDKFISQFTNKTTEAPFEVVKASASTDQEIEAVSGATVSSFAVANAVNIAVNFHKENILGEEVAEEVKPEPTIENMKLTGDTLEEIDGEMMTFAAKSGEEITGYVVYAENPGYYPEMPITVAVGFDLATDTISNILIVNQNETAGIGDVIEEDGFSALFQGKETIPQDIQIYSGATLSSEGSYKAINKAIEYYNVTLKGGN